MALRMGFVLAAAAGLAASPAAAQGDVPAAIGATIGQMNGPKQPDPECLAGRALVPADQAEEARAGSEAAMRAYWSLAGAQPAGDVSALFIPRSKLRGWERTGETGPPAVDPFARAIATGEAAAEPLAFFRSQETPTAVGLWRIRSAGGDELGAYWVWFRRAADAWKMTGLSVRPGPLAPARPTRYCRSPGDVELYREEVARLEAKRARKAAEAAVRAERGRDRR